MEEDINMETEWTRLLRLARYIRGRAKAKGDNEVAGHDLEEIAEAVRENLNDPKIQAIFRKKEQN
jgi:hypothetical protein